MTLSILETGNRHRAHIFKEYKSKTWPEDMPSGYFYLLTGNDDFYEEAILSVEHELLYFRQSASEGFSPAKFQPIEHQCNQQVYLFNPDYLEVIPEVFLQNSINSEIPQHDASLEIKDIKAVLRSNITSLEMPSEPLMLNVSHTELQISLLLNNLLKPTKPNAFLLKRKENGFHLVLFRNGSLMFCNSFDFITYEEVLYFCLQVLKDNNLGQEDTELYYLRADYSEHAVKLWKPYLAGVYSFEEKLNSPNTDSEVPFDLQEFCFFLQLSRCV